MDKQENISTLEEIQKEFKDLTEDVFLILRIDNYSNTLEDEFKQWTNKAKATTNKLKENYSKNQLLTNELRDEISKLNSFVNFLEDELLKEGLKKNGRIIALNTKLPIITERQSLEKYFEDILKELKEKNQHYKKNFLQKNAGLIGEFIGGIIKYFTACYIGWHISLVTNNSLILFLIF